VVCGFWLSEKKPRFSQGSYVRHSGPGGHGEVPPVSILIRSRAHRSPPKRHNSHGCFSRSHCAWRVTGGCAIPFMKVTKQGNWKREPVRHAYGHAEFYERFSDGHHRMNGGLSDYAGKFGETTHEDAASRYRLRDRNGFHHSSIRYGLACLPKGFLEGMGISLWRTFRQTHNDQLRRNMTPKRSMT
jgi:hypothetical protein